MLFDQKIEPHDTLIILDEIQECSSALNSLKYFKEKAVEYHIIAAGSLLGTSFKNYLQTKKPKSAIRFSELGYKKDGEFTNYPLYLAPKVNLQ